MKRLIILLLAALMALLSCAERGHEFDNPWDKDGTDYNGGSRTITFDPNGGGTASPTSSKTNKYKKLDSLPTLTRDGYTFDGWYTTKTGTGGTSITTDTEFDGDATLYARWTLQKYEIAFNATGGTVSPASGTTGDGWKLESLPTPTRANYIFNGWWTATTGGDSVTVDRVYSDKTTIYARWEANQVTLPTYTVTFNVNGGNGSVSSQSAQSGNNITLPNGNNLSKTGFTFDGWNTNNSGTGENYSAGSYYTVTGTATLYAKWNSSSFTGTYGSVAYGGKTYKTIKTSNLTWMAENLDYDVIGSTCYNNSNDSCARYGRLYTWDAAMKACPKGWHIPLDAEWDILVEYAGGWSTAGTTLKSLSYWESYSGVPKGTDDLGFSALPGGIGSSYGSFGNTGIVGGWWSSTENDAYYDACYWNMIYNNEGVYRYNSSKTDLYSVRCVQDGVNTYTITFNVNGGNSLTTNTAVTGADGKLASLPTPTRNGYTFDGWYTAETGGTKVELSRTYSANSTIYARWIAEVNTYTITFNTNGGSGSIPSQHSVQYGDEIVLPNGNNLSRSGFTFGGWNTQSNGNGSNYNGGSYYTVTGAATLYVKWNSSGFTGTYGSVAYGGKTYKTIKIGNLTWFAENLNYDVDGSVCYANNTSNCATYGRLYNWNAAMTACPTGWHLPSDAEWTQLENAVGGSSTAGRKLKSQSGWYSCGPAGSGNSYVCEDAYGFAALPAGYGLSDGGFIFDGYGGYWWSATEYGADGAFCRGMDDLNEYVYGYDNYKTSLLSVRCVQD